MGSIWNTRVVATLMVSFQTQATYEQGRQNAIRPRTQDFKAASSSDSISDGSGPELGNIDHIAEFQKHRLVFQNAVSGKLGFQAIDAVVEAAAAVEKVAAVEAVAAVETVATEVETVATEVEAAAAMEAVASVAWAARAHLGLRRFTWRSSLPF